MIEERMTYSAPGDVRLDTWLSEQTTYTRSQIARLIEEGRISVSGQKALKAGMKPPQGALIELCIPPLRESRVEAEDLPLNIIYQDADIAVVEKPCGMVVHPAAGNESHTLVNALMHHITDLSGIGGEMRPGIVHRLDKDTSGLLLIAKNDAAHLNLSVQLQNRQMEKHYRTVVEGVMKETSGLIDAPIARSRTDRKRMAIDPMGRPSQTEWTLLENLKAAAYLDVHLITGRTHQIRVHMASLHHAVAGDPIYGYKKGIKVPRLMLHAYTLSFTHPVSGDRMTFTSPLPAEYQRVLIALQESSKSLSL